MSFNEEELIKIRDASSGLFKRGARKKIASSLRIASKKLAEIDSLEPEEKREEMIQLLNFFTASRQLAVQQGARGHGHAAWAAAAACESWLQELLNGSPDSTPRVESLIEELISRG
jgi:hypothetical protein